MARWWAQRRIAMLGCLHASVDAPLLGSCRTLLWLLLGAFQLTLLPPKLEGLLICRWRMLLTPTFAWLLFELCATAISCRNARHGGSGRGGGPKMGGSSRRRYDPYSYRHREEEEDDDADDDEETPAAGIRRSLKQWERGLRLAVLLGLGLTLSWGASALDAAEAHRAPVSHLMMPMLLALLSAVGCVGCTCCSAPSPRRAAAKAWAREKARRDKEARIAAGEAATGGGAAADATPQPSTPRESSSGDAAAAAPAFMQAEAEVAEGDVDPQEVMAAAYSMPGPGALPGEMPESVPEPVPPLQRSFPSDAELIRGSVGGEVMAGGAMAGSSADVLPPPAGAPAGATDAAAAGWEGAFDEVDEADAEDDGENVLFAHAGQQAV